jgi:hypothetical protein
VTGFVSSADKSDDDDCFFGGAGLAPLGFTGVAGFGDEGGTVEPVEDDDDARGDDSWLEDEGESTEGASDGFRGGGGGLELRIGAGGTGAGAAGSTTGAAACFGGGGGGVDRVDAAFGGGGGGAARLTGDLIDKFASASSSVKVTGAGL